jgi:hypothetical protein
MVTISDNRSAKLRRIAIGDRGRDGGRKFNCVGIGQMGLVFLDYDRYYYGNDEKS